MKSKFLNGLTKAYSRRATARCAEADPRGARLMPHVRPSNSAVVTMSPRSSARTYGWRDFVDAVTSLRGRWLYRGAPKHWGHETSLQRVCKAWNIPLRSARKVEVRLVREFQRHPEVRERLSDPEDYLGWLALMQHHGAPTRLLDWTYSPFVAAYFAFDALFAASTRPEKGDTHAVIWALDVDWLTGRIRRRLSARDWTLYQRKDSQSFTRLFLKRRPPLRFVGTATPIFLNERLSVQQGVFLCPGDVSAPWADNLTALAGARRRPRIRSFVMSRDAIEDAFQGLARMNVTARSLFPGLEGYAKSIAHRARELWEIPIAGD